MIDVVDTIFSSCFLLFFNKKGSHRRIKSKAARTLLSQLSTLLRTPSWTNSLLFISRSFPSNNASVID